MVGLETVYTVRILVVVNSCFFCSGCQYFGRVTELNHKLILDMFVLDLAVLDILLSMCDHHPKQYFGTLDSIGCFGSYSVHLMSTGRAVGSKSIPDDCLDS